VDLLRQIHQCLLTIRAWLEQLDVENTASEQNRNRHSLPEKVYAIVSFDDETVRTTKAEADRQYRVQNTLKNATWSAFVAAAIYALISLLIWCQMIRQSRTASAALRQSTESFRVDERAWIEIEQIKPVLKAPASHSFGALFTYDIYPKNVGKTAAYDIAVKALRGAPMSDLSLGDNADEIARYQKMLLTNAMGMPDVLISRRVSKTLGPNEVSHAPFDMYCQEPQKGLYQFLIGRVDYADAFRIQHWMTFCFFIADASGNIQYCQEGNNEDRNPELPPD
jgi:hypothetical protein